MSSSSLVYHHMDETSQRLSVPTTQLNAIETGWKHCVMISLATVVNMGYLKS